MKYIFLLTLIGMLVVYPLYFYFLNEFKAALIRDHAEIWAGLSQYRHSSALQVAYRALQLSRGGRIDGVPLSQDSIVARRKAAAFLYAGVFFFLLILGIGLWDSVKMGKV